MSVMQIELDQSLIRLVKKLKQDAGEAFQRRLLVLSGTDVWCRSTAAGILKELPSQQPLWVGQPVGYNIPHLLNPQLSALLGSETELLVYDAFSGFDADAFGALSGTLVGGGILILLTPPLDKWSNYADPEHARIAVAGISQDALTGRFLARLARLIKAAPSVTRLEEGGKIPSLPSRAVIAHVQETLVHACRTSDQHNAVEAVMHVVTGHRRRPVVLISDRGRGKSSALGIAAARLLKAGKQQILVTAPSQKATGSLFAQAARLLPGVEAGKGSLHLDQASIDYVAPDQLLQDPQTADLLLVDEAAAIPTPLLEALLDHYPRIAFATTVHGYEGTGRGFALRFRKVLEQRFPQWREVRLESPIRWAPGDPLEEWLFRALALNAAPAPDELIRHTQVDQCSCESLDRDRLVQHEADLTDLFGLLVLAHYRTTPFDLRHLLDGPNLHVFALRSRGRIVATALLAMEGGFDATTAHAIWAGYRRPRGHLLAQSLAAHVGLEDGACLHGGRIIRIAVHPVLQQRGLGSRLVQEILQFSQATKLDYLGSSFGATTELLRFWGKNHFQPVRIGLRRSASSGAQSVIMLQPITPAGERIFDAAKARFQRQLPQLLADPLQGMDAELAAMLLAHSQPVSDLSFDAFDWLDLIGFAFAQRAYETCLTSLESLSLQALADSLPESAQARLLVMRVIQHRDWTECARILQLTGRTAVETQLRRLAGDLILHYADATTRTLALRIQAEALE